MRLEKTHLPGLLLALACLIISPMAEAAPDPRALVSELEQAFRSLQVESGILDAAKRLFWALATISLAWTMGLLIVRQDIGEVLMELVRFMVVTGTFYWILINASDVGGDGFVSDIVESFFKMIGANDLSFKVNANNIVTTGIGVYYDVLVQIEHANDGDKILAGLMASAVLVASAVMAAQFLLALIMAWLLGYAAIFLLGFGGARWTSSIAISYYKHVIAIGIVLLSLSLIGRVASEFLLVVFEPTHERGAVQFNTLGIALSVFVLLTVLSIRVPQMLYTLVTGSTLGLFAGTAGVVGSTIITGGGAAIAAAGRGGAAGSSGAGGQGGSGGSSGNGGTDVFGSGGGGSGRAESVMDATQRSAASGANASDPFHVGTGSDPFGVPRGAVSGKSASSAFGPLPEAPSMAVAAGSVVSAVSAFGRDLGLSEQGVPHASQQDAIDAQAAGTNDAGTVAHMSPAEEASGARPDYDAEMAAIAAARNGGGSISPASVGNSDSSAPFGDAGAPEVNHAAARNTDVALDGSTHPTLQASTEGPDRLHVDGATSSTTALNDGPDSHALSATSVTPESLRADLSASDTQLASDGSSPATLQSPPDAPETLRVDGATPSTTALHDGEDSHALSATPGTSDSLHVESPANVMQTASNGSSPETLQASPEAPGTLRIDDAASSTATLDDGADSHALGATSGTPDSFRAELPASDTRIVSDGASPPTLQSSPDAPEILRVDEPSPVVSSDDVRKPAAAGEFTAKDDRAGGTTT
jgi:type IV secretion system protein VirB6/type IV secretion system protein TrbL